MYVYVQFCIWYGPRGRGPRPAACCPPAACPRPPAASSGPSSGSPRRTAASGQVRSGSGPVQEGVLGSRPHLAEPPRALLLRQVGVCRGVPAAPRLLLRGQHVVEGAVLDAAADQVLQRARVLLGHHRGGLRRARIGRVRSGEVRSAVQ